MNASNGAKWLKVRISTLVTLGLILGGCGDPKGGDKTAAEIAEKERVVAEDAWERERAGNHFPGCWRNSGLEWYLSFRANLPQILLSAAASQASVWLWREYYSNQTVLPRARGKLWLDLLLLIQMGT